jgi:hypothetical protein
MKKATYLLVSAFLVFTLGGCSITRQSQVNNLDTGIDPTASSEELDENSVTPEGMDSLITDNLDAEFENAINDEIQIDENLDELDSMSF